MVELSRRISATRNRLKPPHAGPAGVPRSAWARSSRKLPCHPSLSAGTRRARSISARDLFGQVQQPVDVRDRELFWSVGGLFDLVAGLHHPLLEYAEVEPRAVVRDEQRRHRRLVHANANAVARDARLGDLEQRFADAVAVPDAHHIVREALHGEVLAELAVGEVVAS